MNYGEHCPVADTIPGLAKGTGSIELASRAEKATTAKPKALGPGAYGKASTGTSCRTGAL